VAPGRYASPGNAYVRFGGYLGRNGPPPNYLGTGGVVAVMASVAVARRRPLTWLLVFMGVVTFLLGLGSILVNGPPALDHVWLPWRGFAHVAVLKEILPDHFAPFLSFFVGALLAVGLDALWVHLRRTDTPSARSAGAVTWVATGAVAVLALVPVLATFDVPLTVARVAMPSYMRQVAPSLPAGTVVLTVPFAVTGSDQPMLWQAVDDFRFRLAGAALKTPNKKGGPVATGAPGSARRILTSLSVGGALEPKATPAEVAAVRGALGAWQVDRVVIAGASRDRVYATGFMTAVVGAGPAHVDGAWVWSLRRGVPMPPPVLGPALSRCRAAVTVAPFSQDPLAMARCVLFAAGRPWTTQP